MDEPAWTDDAIASRLQNLFAEEDVETSDAQWAFREAAAVRLFYELNELRPARPVGDAVDAAALIGGDSDLTYDEHGEPRWTLRPGVRRESIKRLQANGRLRETIDANPEHAGLLQETFESYLLGTAKPLEQQPLEQVRATARVIELLQGVVEDLPDPAHVAQRLERESLLAPLRTLVGEHFAGRQAELDVMTDYVAALGPSGLMEHTVRVIEAAFSVAERPALFIFGPGGIGKSTLVAKFILDHHDVPEAQRIPFAYFDFDRKGLSAEEPITLLFEALSQLGSQYPESKPRITALRQEWGRRVADSAFGTPRASTSWKNLRLKDRDYYVDSFASYIASLGVTSQPVLFVLDTLEEVQLRSQPLVEELLAFLAQLQARIPRLRCVLSGRVVVASTRYPITELPLKTFDRPSARAFLQLKVPGLGEDVADMVARQVGGSPLTLKLAVALLNQDRESVGPDGIKGLQTGMLARLRGETIQSQLYTRILGHIKNDDDVKKLAHPGLILRRITPELILKVLAEPCGVHVPDLAAARSLLSRLAREVVLVTEPEKDVLVHRPDLRAVMLDPLRQAEKDRVETIQRRAIEYYQTLDDPDARAEEIYHRLLLGQDRATVNARWMAGLKKPLQTALEELPAPAQAFLAAKLDLEIDSDLWPEAHQEDWEIYAARRAQEHLKFTRPNDALLAIGEREKSTWTPGSPLYSIEIDALMALGRVADARAAFDVIQKQSERFDPADRRRLDTQRALLDATGAAAPKVIDSSRFRMLLDALVDAVRDRDVLEEMLHVELGRDLDEIAAPGKLSDTLFALVRTADAQGWLGDLIVAARNTYPGNKKLFAIAQILGLSAASTGVHIDGFLAETGHRIDGDAFRRRLTEIEGQVCRMEMLSGDTTAPSTGFLIGPNAVLTNCFSMMRVLDQGTKVSDIIARFDYRGSGSGMATSGTSIRVESIVATSQELGYALLRLQGEPGHDRGVGGSTRGWLPPTTPTIAAGAPLVIVHCGSDGSLNMTLDAHGVTAVEPNGRLRLNVKLAAVGWGAPCFDPQLGLIAMLVGEPQGRRWRGTGNEAVPIDHIMRAISAATAQR